MIARLSAATAATAHLGVLHGAQLLYLAKSHTCNHPGPPAIDQDPPRPPVSTLPDNDAQRFVNARLAHR